MFVGDADVAGREQIVEEVRTFQLKTLYLSKRVVIKIIKLALKVEY